MLSIGITIDFHPITFFGVYLLVSLITIAILLIRKVKFSIALLLSFIFYCLVVFKITILPIRYFFEEQYNYPNLYTQFVPFKTIIHTFSNGNHIQNIGNLLMLSPFTIFLQLIYKKQSAWKSFTILLIISLSIEILQYVINILTHYPNKVTDIDDLLLNVLGGSLSLIVFNQFRKLSIVNKLIAKII